MFLGGFFGCDGGGARCSESQIEQLGPSAPTGDGLTEEVKVRMSTPINGTAQKLLKLRVNQLP